MTVIPNFIVKRLYVTGSLRHVPEGVAFDINNLVGPGILTRIGGIKLGEISYAPDAILLRQDDTLIPAHEISESNPMVFPMHQIVTCIMQGQPVEPGTYTITLDLLSKEAGKIVISIQDTLPPQ
jgi:hypothetical protein